MEIERKYLIEELPEDLENYPFHIIEQGIPRHSFSSQRNSKHNEITISDTCNISTRHATAARCTSKEDRRRIEVRKAVFTPLRFAIKEKECRGIPWLAVLLMGCATLTKGPVGSIFPCVCIGLYQLLRGRSFWKTFFLLFLQAITRDRKSVV